MQDRIMIRITYVTITYNAAKVLQRTLDSVLSQDYPNIVHLIIDGASTDDTLKLVDARSPERPPHTGNLRARQRYLRRHEQRSAQPRWRLRLLSECRRFPTLPRHRESHYHISQLSPLNFQLTASSGPLRRHRHSRRRRPIPASPPTGTAREPHLAVVQARHACVPSGFLRPHRLRHRHTLRYAVPLFGRCRLVYPCDEGCRKGERTLAEPGYGCSQLYRRGTNNAPPP